MDTAKSMKEDLPSLSVTTSAKKKYFKPTHEDMVKALEVVSNPDFNWLGKKCFKRKLLTAATDHLRKEIPTITVYGLEKMICKILDDYNEWSKSATCDFAFMECIDSLEILSKSSANSDTHQRRGRKRDSNNEAFEWEKLRVESEKTKLKQRKLDLQERIFSTLLSGNVSGRNQ